jgi:1-acyl-sn-glycerol-3-phosphate acyltransferase
MVRVFKKIGCFLFSIYGFSIFLLLMFLLLPFFLYCFLLNDIEGGNLLYKICRFWADAFFLLIGVTYKCIYEAEHNRTEQYIFVSNHISYLDIPMMIKAIRKQHARILGKAEMIKIPVFGFIYKKGAVLVNRENQMKRSASVKRLIYFLNKKISVFICPEGTFNTTHNPLKNFYDGAFRIAIETKKPIKPILFLDTYDRLSYKSVFSLNPGRCRAVYLAATSTEEYGINDVSLLKEKIFRQMGEALIRYDATWIK